MPYHKTADGKWIQGDAPKELGDLRLLLVDRQVDRKGVLAKATLPNVVTVEFDSAKDGLNAVLQRVRDAHAEAGQPFVSVAFANHGGQEWKITADLVVSMANSHQAVAALRPLLDTLVAVVDKDATGHIDLLACSLAKVQPSFIPTLEKMYKVDFRASTDNTGNASSGGNWKLETDDDYDFAKDYLDPLKKEEYVEVMDFLGSFFGGIVDTVGAVVTAPAKMAYGLATGDLAAVGDAAMDVAGGVAAVAGGGAPFLMGAAIEAAIDEVLNTMPSHMAGKLRELRDLKSMVSKAKRGRIDVVHDLLKKVKALGVHVPGY